MFSTDEALRILRRHEAELRARGILRAAIFGSFARGEASPDSDIDVLIEIDASARMTVFDYAGVKRMIADFFPRRVDVVNAATMKRGIAKTAIQDAIYAF